MKLAHSQNPTKLIDDLKDVYPTIQVLTTAPMPVFLIANCRITIYEDMNYNANSAIYLETTIDNEAECKTNNKLCVIANKLITEKSLFEAAKWLCTELDVNFNCPGFEEINNSDADDDAYDDDDDNFRILESQLPELDVKSDRQLGIWTWGVNQKGSGGSPHPKSDFNVNASVISSSKKGLNLKQLDGRDSKIQRRVCRAKAFEFLLRSTVKKIESTDAKQISVNCSKGRHRSVAFAEILRDHYYPNAKVVNPNLRK